MFYDAARRDHGLAQDPLKSLIVPRPIGWISTIDGQGRVNLAPYSFYNAVSEFPPMVYFAITGRYGDTPTKHSRMNAEETGEFVVNMVAGTLTEKMNITTAMVAYGIDEMKLAGLTPAPCKYVKPPRVAESPVALECTLHTTVELGDCTLVIGQVRHLAIDETMLDGNHPDIHRLRPLARLGKDEWTTLGEVRSITRIRYSDWPGHFEKPDGESPEG